MKHIYLVNRVKPWLVDENLKEDSNIECVSLFKLSACNTCNDRQDCAKYDVTTNCYVNSIIIASFAYVRDFKVYVRDTSRIPSIKCFEHTKSTESVDIRSIDDVKTILVNKGFDPMFICAETDEAAIAKFFQGDYYQDPPLELKPHWDSFNSATTTWILHFEEHKDMEFSSAAGLVDYLNGKDTANGYMSYDRTPTYVESVRRYDIVKPFEGEDENFDI